MFVGHFCPLGSGCNPDLDTGPDPQRVSMNEKTYWLHVMKDTCVRCAGNYVYCADLNLPWDCSVVCSLSAPATCLAWNGAGTGYLLLLRYSTCTWLFGLVQCCGFAFITFFPVKHFQQNSDTDVAFGKKN
jgi:hypothetical protein